MYRFLTIFAFSLGFFLISEAQIAVTDDFEGNGTITTWFGDACVLDINYSNPFQEGINNSETVLFYGDTGGQYANIRFDVLNNFDLSENNVFSFKIYVPATSITGEQANQVSLKLQDGKIGAPWTTQCEIIQPIVLNQWQIVSFDFANDTYFNLDETSLPPTERTDFNRIVLQVNGENNTDNVLAYFDDFYYNGTVSDEIEEPEIPETPDSTDLPIFDKLVWADEFDYNGAIDNEKWFAQTQLPAGGGWFNGELQHYTNRIENAYVDNGSLKIVAIKEQFTDQGHTKDYTSARLNSKFAFQYGRVEVRAKLPTGVGTWPAIWMLGKNITESGAYWQTQGFGTTGWPACGEIDIMEHWGTNQNYVQSAMHTPSSFGATENHGGQTIPTVSTDYHVYTLDWSAQQMIFSVDDVVHYIYNPPVKDAATWPFDAEQYLLLNIAIQSSITNSFTQSDMDIDYIRIYQESDDVEEPTSNNSEISEKLTFYPNPIDDTLTINLLETTNKAIDFNFYNIEGRLIKTYSKTANTQQITFTNLSDLPLGTYLVSYKINAETYSFKVMKQ